MRRTKAGATVTIPDKIGYVTPVLRHSSSAFKLVRGKVYMYRALELKPVIFKQLR